MYSDSAVADIECPFEISSGRLGEPVEISWSFADSQGNRVVPIINATSGVYFLEEEGNRILHVNISTLGPLRYQCAGQVEICERRTSCMLQLMPSRTSCMQLPPSRSPAFAVFPRLGKLYLNLYTCVALGIVLCVPV